MALPPPQPSPEPWSSQSDEFYSGAGYHYEKGIIQIENARVNARHASRKLKAQFRHAKSDDIVDSMLLNRRLRLLQRPKSIDTTLQRISQEQGRCREKLRLLKAASNHQFVDQAQDASKFMSECLSDYVEEDDDDSSGYFSSDSASQSTGSMEEAAINDVPTLDETGMASNIQGNGCDYAFVVFPAAPSEKDLHANSRGTMSTKGSSSPQTPPDANGADLSTEEMSHLIPISLFEVDGASSSIVQSDYGSSSDKSREFQDIWAWFEDSHGMAETKRRKARRARISMKKSSKILCFRKKKRKRYAAMDDQMSLLSEV